MIFIVSDGVHDNLDPETLGLTPVDIGVDPEKIKSLSSIDIIKPQNDELMEQSNTETDLSETSTNSNSKKESNDANANVNASGNAVTLSRSTSTMEKNKKVYKDELTEAQRRSQVLNAASMLVSGVSLSTPTSSTFAVPTIDEGGEKKSEEGKSTESKSGETTKPSEGGDGAPKASSSPDVLTTSTHKTNDPTATSSAASAILFHFLIIFAFF